MKIALVEPSVSNDGRRAYDDHPEPAHLVGMMHMGADAGADIDIIDAYTHKLTPAQLVDLLAERSYSHVGITTYDYAPCREYVERVLYGLPRGVTTILGGPGATYSPARIANRLQPDWLIQGEGEHALSSLVMAGFDHRRIPHRAIGATRCVKSPPLRLDAIPHERPYALEPYHHEASPRVQRGCVGRCVFCSGAYQKAFSYVSPRTFRGLLYHLVHERQAAVLSPCGPDFTALPDAANDLVRVLVETDLPLESFRPGVRLDTLHAAVTLDPELWRALSRRLPVAFESSIESFDRNRLARLGKAVSTSFMRDIKRNLALILETCPATISLGRIAFDPRMSLEELITDTRGFIELLETFPTQVTIGGMLMNSFVPLWGTPAMATRGARGAWYDPESAADPRVALLREKLVDHVDFRRWCRLAEQVGKISERNTVFREILRVVVEHARSLVTLRREAVGTSRA